MPLFRMVAMDAVEITKRGVRKAIYWMGAPKVLNSGEWVWAIGKI